LLPYEEKEKIDRVFRTMDLNGDGVLSKDEIIKGYKDLFDIKMSDEKLAKIYYNVDGD